MKKLAVILLATLVAMNLSACNAWHGFGQDMKKVGEKISGDDEDKKSSK